MHYHVAIHIENALAELRRGKNYLDCTPLEAFGVYMDAMNAGKKYYSACDRQTHEGRCMGHKEKTPLSRGTQPKLK